MPALLSNFVMKPKRAATRELDMRVAIVSPIQGPEMHMIGLENVFNRVILVGLFTPHWRVQGVIGIPEVRLALVRVMGPKLVFQGVLVVILGADHLRVFLTVVKVRVTTVVVDNRVGKVIPRGGRLGGRTDGQHIGGSGHFNAAPARENAEASNDVITSTILLCHQPTLNLFNPGTIYSYLSMYHASHLGMSYEPMVVPMHVSTLT
ncbi:hypothetical protein MTR67_001381, partial [Solanum verrucosum]